MRELRREISDYDDDFEVDYGVRTALVNCWLKKDSEVKVSNISPTDCKKRKIFPVPTDKAFIEYLCGMVKQSKEMICLSSFMLQQSDLTEAIRSTVSRGVRVYILTAGEEELARADTDIDDIEKLKLEDYKQLLNSMAGVALIRMAPHFHAKFLLIDPKSENPLGVMMTCNATVDAMTGKNLEAAISLTALEVRSFFAQFLKAFWKESKHELLEPNRLSDVRNAPNGIVFEQPASHLVTITGSTTLKNRLLELIESAKQSITATGWSFGFNHPVVGSLEKALDRGISVTIYARPSYSNTAALANLAGKGARVIGQERYHAKTVIVDAQSAIMMTSNYTEKGLDTGFETGVELDSEETRVLISMTERWNRQCDWKMVSKLALRDAPLMILKGIPATRKMESVEVSDSVQKDLELHTMTSLDEPRYQPTFSNPADNSTKLYKKVKYRWNVKVPVLPRRASPLQSNEKFQFPVYRLQNGGDHFVVINKWEDIAGAKILAERFKAKIVIQRRENPPQKQQQSFNSKK